jgi:AcrR family transcriptional regulator
MPIDRRVARTRNALYDALVALILRQGYEATTVQDLITEANVGRATFYSHFTSKEDLLQQSLGRLALILSEAAAGVADPERRAWSLVLFEHIAEFRSVYFALVGIEAGEVLRNALHKVIRDFVAQRIEPDGSLPAELKAESVAALFLTLITWWLNRRPTLSTVEVDTLFGRLLAGPLQIR